MKKELLPVVIFVLLSFFIALIIHKKVKNYFIASILSSIVSSLLYQAIGFLVLGYLDPFFFIAFINGTGAALVIALIVGIPIAYKRSR